MATLEPDENGFRTKLERREYILRQVTHLENGSRLSKRDRKILFDVAMQECMVDMVKEAFDKSQHRHGNL